MIEVVIDSIRVNLTNQQRIVILRQVDQERYLPIWIGPFEAEAITIALQEIEVARPQTHDLVRNILTHLNVRLERVEVVALQEDVFYGVLVLEVEGGEVRVDSRPSDALALAARVHAPIFVAEDVMNTAAIVPEEDIQQEREAPSAAVAEEEPEEHEGHLDVFESFLNNLNFDLPGDQPGGEGPDVPGDDPGETP
ncbi:MAG TPA: bifunctional nuclease family protein [Anaerolineaceae bacterium]|nr:bifunctional nuclease family protein [Anaerolineaceae bacterium]HQL38862.1 bifunctional nuclease family protein [Anaerolineaceae bacterium]